MQQVKTKGSRKSILIETVCLLGFFYMLFIISLQIWVSNETIKYEKLPRSNIVPVIGYVDQVVQKTVLVIYPPIDKGKTLTPNYKVVSINLNCFAQTPKPQSQVLLEYRTGKPLNPYVGTTLFCEIDYIDFNDKNTVFTGLFKASCRFSGLLNNKKDLQVLVNAREKIWHDWVKFKSQEAEREPPRQLFHRSSKYYTDRFKNKSFFTSHVREAVHNINLEIPGGF